ncbi:MAG TPA: hypothetical protein VGD60_06125 [Candidatus Acidoferrales bacterium]
MTTEKILSILPLLVLILPSGGFLIRAARGQSSSSTTWAVSIVLPPKLVAGRPATLAVLGVDGRLAEGIAVMVGDSLHLKTDKTGRASFSVPAGPSVLIASGSGNSAAALVDTPESAGEKRKISVPPVVSLLDQFAICGAEFAETADANRVSINGERAFILAASPECVVVQANPRALPGPAKITIENSSGSWEGATTLVSLHFDPPIPALVPEKRSKLALHVQGSSEPLRVQVENRTPGVLRFLHGDTQSLTTSGDAENSAIIGVEAIRAGDFSFRARLLPVLDPDSARRYLLAASVLAPKVWKSRVAGFARDLERHPDDAAKIGRDLQAMATTTIPGDFKTLIEAARAALQ